MRMLSFVFCLSVAALASAADAVAPGIQMFNSEAGAQVHCPLDKVVWLEPRQHLFYYQSSKHYANSGTGGFVCRKDAIEAGNKPGT